MKNSSIIVLSSTHQYSAPKELASCLLFAHHCGKRGCGHYWDQTKKCGSMKQIFPPLGISLEELCRGVCSKNVYYFNMYGMISKLFICIASNSVMLGLPNNKFFGPAKLGRGTSRENHWFSPPMKSREIFLRITTWLVLNPHLVAHLLVI